MPELPTTLNDGACAPDVKLFDRLPPPPPPPSGVVTAAIAAVKSAYLV